MVTAGSTAHLALILVDARKGVRHPDPAPRLHRPPARHPAPGRRREQDGPGRLVRRRSSTRIRARLPGLRRRGSASRTCASSPSRALPATWWSSAATGCPGTAGRPCSSILEAAPAAHTEGTEPLPLPGAVGVPAARTGAPRLPRPGRAGSSRARWRSATRCEVLPSGRQEPGPGHLARRARAAARPAASSRCSCELDERAGRLARRPPRQPGAGPEPTRTVDAAALLALGAPALAGAPLLSAHTTRESRAQVAESPGASTWPRWSGSRRRRWP